MQHTDVSREAQNPIGENAQGAAIILKITPFLVVCTCPDTGC
jgi:hypothetical protein